MQALRAAVAGKIIDIHAHIASTDYFPEPFIAGILDNVMAALSARGMRLSRAKVGELYLSRFQDPLCDQLVEQMDNAGVAQSVLLLADFTYALKGGRASIAQLLEQHIAVAWRHPNRLLVFAGVDPRWGKDGLDLFERAAASRAVAGYKVYPPCGFRPSDDMLYPFYEICAKHSIPALVHIGATSPVLDFEPAHPLYIDRAARDFPGVNFILAHGSVHHPNECAMLCSHRPNVFLDVSGYEVAELHKLKHLFEHGINHKVLFGTDWPLFRLKGTQRDFVDMLTSSPDVFPPRMSTAEVEGFFFENARRVLNLEPARGAAARVSSDA